MGKHLTTLEQVERMERRAKEARERLVAQENERLVRACRERMRALHISAEECIAYLGERAEVPAPEQREEYV